MDDNWLMARTTVVGGVGLLVSGCLQLQTTKQETRSDAEDGSQSRFTTVS